MRVVSFGVLGLLLGACGVSTDDVSSMGVDAGIAATTPEALTVSQIMGQVDSIDTGSIRGWVCKYSSTLSEPNEIQKPLWVHVYDETGATVTYLGSSVASSEFRAEAQSLCGSNTRYAGFNFATPKVTATAHTIRTLRVYATEWNDPTPSRGSNAALVQYGVSTYDYANLWSNGTSPNGVIDSITSSSVTGWACDAQDGKVTVSLSVQYNGVGKPHDLGTTDVAIERPDLTAVCNPYQSAHPYGFAFNLPADLPPGKHNFFVTARDLQGHATVLMVGGAGGPGFAVIPDFPSLVASTDRSLQHTECWVGASGIGTPDGQASAAEPYPTCDQNATNAPCCTGACGAPGHCSLRGDSIVPDGTCVLNGSASRGPDALYVGEANPTQPLTVCSGAGAGCCYQSKTTPFEFGMSTSADTPNTGPEPLFANGAFLGDPARVRYSGNQNPLEIRVDAWNDPDTTPIVGSLQRCDENFQSFGFGANLFRDGSSDDVNPGRDGAPHGRRTLEKGIWADVDFSSRADFFQLDKVHNQDGEFGPSLSDGWRDGYQNPVAGQECGLPGLYCPGTNGRFYSPYSQVVVRSHFNVVDCAKGLPSNQISYLSGYPGTCEFDLDLVPFWDTGTVGGQSTTLCQHGDVPQAAGTFGPYVMKRGPGGGVARLNARVPTDRTGESVAGSLSSILYAAGSPAGRMGLGENRALHLPLHDLFRSVFTSATAADLAKLEVSSFGIGVEGWGKFRSAIDVTRLAVYALPQIPNSSFEDTIGYTAARWTFSCTARGIPCATPTLAAEWPWYALVNATAGSPYLGSKSFRLNSGTQSTNPTTDVVVRADSEAVPVAGLSGQRVALTAALRRNIQTSPVSAKASMRLLQFDRSMVAIPAATLTLDFEQGGGNYFHVERLEGNLHARAAFVQVEFSVGGDTNAVQLDVDAVSLAPVETCDGQNDGNLCTTDTCSNGVAVHTPVTVGAPCSDDDPCNGTETCGANAVCQAGTSVKDDANPCTTDSCNAAGVVQHVPTPGVACNDGNACTQGDTCSASAACVGTAVPTDDGNPCTDDTCSAALGVKHTPRAASAACGTGLACDGAGRCGAPLPLPPADPASTAPPLPPGPSISLQDRYQSIYDGPNAVQTSDSGLASVIIDPKRMSVLHGTISDANGIGLPSVTIRVLGHPEMGKTLSRTDGKFDIVVNGGGYLNLVYDRPGYFSVHRKLKPGWKEDIGLLPVTMVPPDAQYNGQGVAVPPVTISRTACNPATTTCPFVVVRGRKVLDADGARQATALIRTGTQATLRFANGTTQMATRDPLVRATEYTDGTRGGESAMPAEIPFGVAYTYAVELSLDEAVEQGAVGVDLSWGVPIYAENYRRFPTGAQVPLGFYDRQTAAWVPMKSGRVLRITKVLNHRASLDLDGDGLGDQAGDLSLAADLQIAEDERLVPKQAIDEAFGGLVVAA